MQAQRGGLPAETIGMHTCRGRESGEQGLSITMRRSRRRVGVAASPRRAVKPAHRPLGNSVRHCCPEQYHPARALRAVPKGNWWQFGILRCRARSPLNATHYCPGDSLNIPYSMAPIVDIEPLGITDGSPPGLVGVESLVPYSAVGCRFARLRPATDTEVGARIPCPRTGELEPGSSDEVRPGSVP